MRMIEEKLQMYLLGLTRVEWNLEEGDHYARAAFIKHHMGDHMSHDSHRIWSGVHSQVPHLKLNEPTYFIIITTT